MTLNQTKLKFPPLARQATGYLDKLPEELPQWVALDCESDGLGPGSLPVAMCVATGDAEWYLPFGHQEGKQYDPPVVRRWMVDQLAGKDIIFREAKTDLRWCREWGVDLEAIGARPHEVQHAAALLDDRRRHFTLDDLAQDRLGVKKLELPPGAIHELPADVVAPYGRRDARLTYDLHTSYAPDIEAQGLTEVLALEDDLIWCVAHMERTGVPLDVPKLERWDGEILQAYVEHVNEIHRRTGLMVNPDTGQDMAKLFNYLGKSYGKTLKNQPSFEEDFLLRHAGHWEGNPPNRRWVVDCPEIQLAVEARQLKSLRSKYTSKYLRGHIGGMLYYRLHQLRADDGGTITGRFASSGYTQTPTHQAYGGNIQQVMKPDKQDFITRRWIIRELFLPGRDVFNLRLTVHDEANGDLNGRWFHADASQIEYRLFAHYSNIPWPHSKRLIEAYTANPNTDFHQLVTDDILHGVMARVFAKNWNFRKLYGGGVLKSSIMTGLDLDTCEEMDAEYDRLFPEAKRLLNYCTRLAERRGWVKTLLGRRRRYYPGDRFYSALNSILQGGAADIMKLKLKRLYDERKTIKDQKLLEECFAVQEATLRVPLTWETGVGSNWKEAS